MKDFQISRVSEKTKTEEAQNGKTVLENLKLKCKLESERNEINAK